MFIRHDTPVVVLKCTCASLRPSCVPYGPLVSLYWICMKDSKLWFAVIFHKGNMEGNVNWWTPRFHPISVSPCECMWLKRIMGAFSIRQWRKLRFPLKLLCLSFSTARKYQAGFLRRDFEGKNGLTFLSSHTTCHQYILWLEGREKTNVELRSKILLHRHVQMSTKFRVCWTQDLLNGR